MDSSPRKRRYFMRVTIEIYDKADPKTRRYAAPAEHFEGIFYARDDNEARVLQAHCWHVCGVAVYNELYNAPYGDKKAED